MVCHRGPNSTLRLAWVSFVPGASLCPYILPLGQPRQPRVICTGCKHLLEGSFPAELRLA